MASCAGTSNGYTITLNVSQGTQSVASNYTSVSWSLVLNWGSNYYQNSATTDTFKAVINGTTVYHANRALYMSGGNGSMTIASGSLHVYHDANGAKSISYSCTFTPGRSASYYPSSMSGSGSMALTTIPRATTPTITYANTGILGTSATITLPRSSTSFTHKVVYTFGNTTGTISTAATTSVTWTIPLTLANQIPNATSGTGSITVTTLSGSTVIGTKSVPFTVKIPDTMIPTVSSIAVTRVDNGVPSAWGQYVKTISKATVVINGTGTYGSSIQSYAISGGGFSATSSSAVIGPFTSSGTIMITCVVTDSRGMKASKTTSITVVDYAMPTLKMTAVRCDSGGTISNTGTCVKITPTYSISSVSSKNAVTSRSFKVGTYTNTACASGASVILGAGTISQNSTYTATGTITDSLGKSTTVTVDIPIATVPFNIRSSKKGVGIGRYGTTDSQLQIGYLPHFFNNLFYFTNETSYQGQIRIGKNNTSYMGFDEVTNNYLRMPTNGILPNSSVTTGLGNIGTSSWPFSSGHIKTLTSTTGNITTVNATTMKATNVETTNLTINGVDLNTRLAKLHMVTGTVVKTVSNATSVVLFSNFASTYGSHPVCLVTNGDGNAQAAHIQGTTIQGSSLFAVFDRAVTGSIRMNYVIFYAK